jgi:hypothetical protein
MECTRLGFSGSYDGGSLMAQLPPKKRKKRRIQLREAQRRRRARLKEESRSFLQIILSQETLLALRHYSDLVSKPLHACAAELIERGLSCQGQQESQHQESQQQEVDVPVNETLPPDNGEGSESGQPASESSEDPGKLSTDQMELFTG